MNEITRTSTKDSKKTPKIREFRSKIPLKHLVESPSNSG